jgi:hypothetical protein
MANKARSFPGDATGHYISIPDDANLSLPDGSWTLLIPVRATAATGGSAMYFLSWGGYGAANSINVYMYDTDFSDAGYAGKLGVAIYDSSASPAALIEGGVGLLLGNGWKYLIVEHDSVAASTKFYCGTTEVGTSGGAVPAINNGGNLVLGNRSNTLSAAHAFGGDMAEVGLIGRLLTTQERTDLHTFAKRLADFGADLLWGYELGTASPETPLVAGMPNATVHGTTSISGPFSTAPTIISIDSPAAGSSVAAGTALQLKATITGTVASVAWYRGDPDAGGTLLGSTNPYLYDTAGRPNGSESLYVKATNAEGAGKSSRTLTIGAGSGGTTLILEDDVQQEILQSGVAATVRVALRDSTGAVLKTNPLASGDVKKSVDGATPVVLTNDANAAGWTVVNGFVNIPLSAGPPAEVTGNEITLFIEDQDGSAYLDRVVKIMVVGYDPRLAPASTTEVAGAVADELRARLVS